MYVIKRDGRKVDFDKRRISNAIIKAMNVGDGINYDIANKIAQEIEDIFYTSNVDMSIYVIEKIVYEKLITYNHKNTARLYEGYRAVREYQRKTNDIDNQIFNITKDKDNSNKNPQLISTMRDLTAEVISKDISLRMLLPPDIVEAHNEGIIYIHDLGHYLNPSINCELINLEDILQNGTVINGKMIEKPHSFRTACTIATQAIAQVASGQFGGQTITLTHLAPFVRISYEAIKKKVYYNFSLLVDINNVAIKEKINEIINKELKKEISDGIQTFQYQINTLQTSNGQAPFLSVFMYVNENPEYKEETAMIIEEMLNQRILGMKNKVGAYISPAFPKLLYALDEDNIHEGDKYWYLTKLAAKCVVNRMMPDFLSVKKLKENYEGVVTPPMGKQKVQPM